jgi:hypothetical protein
MFKGFRNIRSMLLSNLLLSVDESGSEELINLMPIHIMGCIICDTVLLGLIDYWKFLRGLACRI